MGVNASNARCIYRQERIPILFTFLIIIIAWCNLDFSYSIKTSLFASGSLENNIDFQTSMRRCIPNRSYKANNRFSIILLIVFTYITLCLWTCNMLLLSGDIHPNPGPASSIGSSSRDSVTNSSSEALNFSYLSNHL